MTERLPIKDLIETHEGGGQYDSVTVLMHSDPTTGQPGGKVACNRLGSVHCFATSAVARDVLGQLGHGLRLADAVNWCKR
jgi:hypothetical protein